MANVLYEGLLVPVSSFWISETFFSFVSMTNILQKIVPRPVKIPKSQKMLAFPSFIERGGKSMVTRKVNDQLEATASPEATPFVSGVKSSATSIYGIGPSQVKYADENSFCSKFLFFFQFYNFYIFKLKSKVNKL